MTGRFETLIAHARDLIATVDRGGALTYCTPSVQQILGLPPASVLGQLLWEMVHPEDILGLQSALADVFETGQSRTIFFRSVACARLWRSLMPSCVRESRHWNDRPASRTPLMPPNRSG
jgi:PAS domain S-box-containing protein